MLQKLSLIHICNRLYSWSILCIYTVLFIFYLQFILVALVHLFDKNSLNSLFNLHIICSLVHIMTAMYHSFRHFTNAFAQS